jgi:nucleoside 2-deoxyribosyltransferase
MQVVYLAGPISGLKYEEATQWRHYSKIMLRPCETVSPLRGADTQPEKYFNPNGERWTSMKAIFNRDHYDVMNCDALLINFIGAKTVSKGTLMEIAWAHAYRKPMVMAIEGPSNPNWDVFIMEAVPFVEHTLDDAIQTIRLLLNVGLHGHQHQSERSSR